MIKKTSDKSDLIKVNTATAIVVLAMHIGIAAALVHMQGPKPIVKKPEEVKPIEIQMLSMQEAVEPPSAVQPEQNTPQVSQEQVAKAQSQTKPASKPEEAEKPETKPVKQNKTEPEVSEPQTKSEPQVEHEPIEEAPSVNKSDPDPQLQTEPKTNLETDPKLETEPDTDLEVVTKIKKTPIIDDNEHQRLIEQAAREQAAREQAAREQAAREQAAANNTPKSFSSSQARWKQAPRFELPKQIEKRVLLGEVFSLTLEVIADKQGNVTKVTVLNSSGNQAVDNATVKELKRSKLHPFTEGGLPVAGKIIIPIDYSEKRK